MTDCPCGYGNNGIYIHMPDCSSMRPLPASYRGWRIAPEYIGYSGTHPDYDASYEGPEDGWVSNGLSVNGMTAQDVRDQIDDYLADNPNIAVRALSTPSAPA